MKNQYVGDIGDFGKYSLLRAFVEAGVKVGVNWYLTENDGSKNGKFTDYLDKGQMRSNNEEIFDVLKGIACKKDKSVFDIEKSGILKDAMFFTDIIEGTGGPAERRAARKQWFEKSMEALSKAELVYMDPDNGLLESGPASKLGAEKFALPDEVKQYFDAGHNVVYYCHKGRRSYDAWEAYRDYMFDRLPQAKPAILTYHKGSQRSFIFLIHEESFVKYRKIIDGFLPKWYRVFSEENSGKGNPADETVGDYVSLKKSDGTIITIKNRADGRVQIENSRKPGTSAIMDVDLFCRYIEF